MIDNSAIFKLSYGLFVLFARNNDKDNACIQQKQSKERLAGHQQGSCGNSSGGTEFTEMLEAEWTGLETEQRDRTGKEKDKDFQDSSWANLIAVGAIKMRWKYQLIILQDYICCQVL